MRFPAEYFEPIARRSGISFTVGLPGARQFTAGDGRPAFALRFRTWPALIRTMARAHIGLLEGYFDCSVDIDGDLRSVMASRILRDTVLSSRIRGGATERKRVKLRRSLTAWSCR